jgi:hypothetical protein
MPFLTKKTIRDVNALIIVIPCVNKKVRIYALQEQVTGLTVLEIQATVTAIPSSQTGTHH